MILRITLLAVLGLLALPALAQSTHNTGTVTLQVFGDGTLGQNLGIGSGFTFGGANGLYEGQLMVGNSGSRVSGQPYFANPGTPPTDWVQVQAPTALTPPFPAPFDLFDQGYSASFTDAAAPQPFGITVRQRTYSSSTAPNNDFVIVVYDITNGTGTAYNGMHVGFFADWDVNAAVANLAGYDAATGSLYVYDTAAATSYYGTSVLGATVSGYNLEVGAGQNPLDGDIFNGMVTPGAPPAAPDDMRSIIGQGPFTLPANGSIQAVFALVAGADEADFLVNAAAARLLFPVAGEAGPQTTTDALSAPAPNPASGTARVTLSLDAPQSVRVSVVDVLGRTVAVLHEGSLAAGATPLAVPTDGLAPGVYVIRAEGETFRQTRTLTVAR
jgi:hypothetical protein